MIIAFICSFPALIFVNWIWGLSGLLLGMIAGGIGIFLYSRYSIYSILETEKKKYLKDLEKDTKNNPVHREIFKYIGIVGILKKRKNDKQEQLIAKNNTIAELMVQNDELFKDVEQLKKRLINLKMNKEIQTSEGEEIYGRLHEPVKKNENPSEIFFTIPENDGSFRFINAKFTKGVDCFYKIIPDKSDQKGALHYLSGEYDLRALENIDYYLNPVCEIQNISGRTFAKRIVMTEAGQVIRRNDSWLIDENRKVKVKLV
jgi:hypothetical protein